MPLNAQGITPSDLLEAQRIFDVLGLPYSRICFHYETATDCWQVRDCDDSSIKAERPPADSQWVEK